ncbi:Ydc2-catalyt domain-containing protein [Candida albicans]
MIQKSYLIERLRSCKISTLNDLAILTGSPIISTNKSCRIEGLTAGYYFYLNHYHKFLSTQKQRTTLSIDVGIKNFSYCKSKSSSSSSTLTTSNFPIIITKWDKLNLDTQYGGDNYSSILHKDSILDNKRYLNQLTKSLVNELQPNEYDVVIMEIQRTRSAGNTSTLPTVLLNYTL